MTARKKPGPVPNPEARRIARTVKASAAEWARLSANAAAAGVTRAEYIRSRCCGPS